MSITSRLLLIVSILTVLTPPLVVFAQASPPEVRAKLLLADNKSAYRIGEPIKLILEFTADREGFRVDTIPDGWQITTDKASISPATGVTAWLDEYFSGQRYSRDVSSSQALSKVPTRVELFLNDTIRFDSPGKYTVKIDTSRVSPITTSPDYSPPIPLTTNSVTFELQPMSEAEEAKEVKRLSDLLNVASGWQAEERITRELSYLTGDASAREKVRRFLNSEGRSGNYHQHINFGLYIARNRALVLRLLESAMRDSSTPVTWSLLSSVTALRVLLDNGPKGAAALSAGSLSPGDNLRLAQIEQPYLAELAAGLGKRVGKSQTTTAMTILMRLPKEPKPGDPILAEVRRLLIQHFDSLHPFDQEYLLRTNWEKLRDPELVPSLEKMLSYRGSSSKNVHDEALKRLIEMAPEKARQYVIAEIRDPQSLADLRLLHSLSDESLPEIDANLLEQIRKLITSSVNFDRVYLKHKVSLAARYASKSIYPELMEVYTSVGSKLPLEVRAGLLAYLAKHNEAEALPLIEQTAGELKEGQDFNFLPELARFYYSDGIDSILRKRLESDDPQTVSTAAYLISLHGPAGDQKIIEARLARWLKEWRHRASEADANHQGIAERELIMALGTAKSWKLPPEYVKGLQQACVTKICKQNFQIK